GWGCSTRTAPATMTTTNRRPAPARTPRAPPRRRPPARRARPREVGDALRATARGGGPRRAQGGDAAAAGENQLARAGHDLARGLDPRADPRGGPGRRAAGRPRPPAGQAGRAGRAR